MQEENSQTIIYNSSILKNKHVQQTIIPKIKIMLEYKQKPSNSITLNTIPLEKSDQEPVRRAENSNLSNLVKEYLPERKEVEDKIVTKHTISHV